MADQYSPGFQDSMGALNKLIAQQEGIAQASPQSALSNTDPVMLGLAQGLLSPTKTGGFGESIGQGIAGMQGPLETMRKQQQASRDKLAELQLARAKLQMEAPYYQARADLAQGRATQLGSLRAIDELHLLQARSRYAGAMIAAPEEEKPRYQDMIDSIDQELASRRGVSYTPQQKTEAPQDTRSWLEKILPESLGGKQAPAAPEPQKATPKASEDNKPAQQPAKGQLYQGDTAPKEYPNAVKAPDGSWYVVKDGKYYPVLQ